MKEKYKVIIIGGGASGVACALEIFSGAAPFSSEDVLILEANDRLLKKLSASGNGQGNIGNACVSEKNYSGDERFVAQFIRNYEDARLIEYLNALGVLTVTEKNGRIYPMSMQANSVTDILRYYLAAKNAKILFGEKVVEVSDRNGVFQVTSQNGNKFMAENVVLSFGGKAGSQFGTDGTSYALAEKFGHKTTKLYPSLVQLKTEKAAIKGLNGVKERAKLSLFDKDKFLKSASGDILFTEYGISGNAVFQISDKAVTAESPVVVAEFLPEIEEDVIAREIERRLKAKIIGKEDIFTGILNKKLGQAITRTVKSFDGNTLAHAVKNYRFNVTGTLGFNYAQVTKGGISTADIDSKTYRSKLKKGLYIVGEALDVDGECGGYNLTFAFVSGMAAAKDIKNGYINHKL